jgi:hypothetical protein
MFKIAARTCRTQLVLLSQLTNFKTRIAGNGCEVERVLLVHSPFIDKACRIKITTCFVYFFHNSAFSFNYI